MGHDNIDTQHLTVTGAHAEQEDDDTHVKVEGGRGSDEVLIIVTQAYGPKGDSLIGLEGAASFDGYPAVTVGVRAAGREGRVHLSPFHGDPRKVGMTDLPVGARCELFCPVSGEPLDRLGEIPGASGGGYFAIYLTPRLSEGEVVAISNIWGDYHSRIVDNYELISAWANQDEALEQGDDGEPQA